MTELTGKKSAYRFHTICWSYVSWIQIHILMRSGWIERLQQPVFVVLQISQRQIVRSSASK